MLNIYYILYFSMDKIENKDFENQIKMRYKIGFEKGPISPNAHICENLETEVEASEVSLSSFDLHNDLADIWEADGTLNLRVRDKLLEIADDFWDTVDINWVKPETVIIVGSIANYNWSVFSDIDLHLVVDFKKIHKNKDFVQDYFNEKKKDWNDTHDNLEIMGFPVELYVQDVNAKTESTAIYDLEEDEWVKKPNAEDFEPIGDKRERIKVIASKLMTKIEDYETLFSQTKDLHQIEALGEKIDSLIGKLTEYRKKSLEKNGEMSEGNIVYKCLRRGEYIDKLYELQAQIYDKINSI